MAIMENSFQVAAVPGAPLFPVSLERANQQSRVAQLPTSPSLPEIGDAKDHAPGSGVQNKVAQFNSMEKDAVERRKTSEAALRRALIGREEAEGENKRMRDELRALRKEIHDGKDRERRVAERLETLVEEVYRAKATQAHAQTAYEKELRRARKETFKSSSALVALQEKLKATRNSLRLTQSGFEQQRIRADKREQAAFKAEYNLVELQQELDNARQLMKKVEEERDAIHASLKEEEIARVAAEGKIALPPSSGSSDSSYSPKTKKKRKSVPKDDFELFCSESEDEDEDYRTRKQIAQLRYELNWERGHIDQLKDVIEFMQVECQFKCCPCRRAEKRGEVYVYDKVYAKQMEEEERRHKNESRAKEEEESTQNEGEESTYQRGHDQEPDKDQTNRNMRLSHERLRRTPIKEDGVQEHGQHGHQRSNPAHRPEQRPVEDERTEIISGNRSSKGKGKQKGESPDLQSGPSSGTSSPVNDDVPLPATARSFNTAKFIPDSPSPSPTKHSSSNDDDTFSAIPFPINLASTPRPLPKSPRSSFFSVTPHPPRQATPSASKPTGFGALPPAPTPPSAPTPQSVRDMTFTTKTTTTRVPLSTASPDDRLAEGATMSRQEALEQIRQRRGRARSVAAGALTPKRQMTGKADRRDISAPGTVGKLATEPRRGRIMDRF